MSLEGETAALAAMRHRREQLTAIKLALNRQHLAFRSGTGGADDSQKKPRLKRGFFIPKGASS
jgi:DNA-binding FadR family transcriptional regulator